MVHQAHHQVLVVFYLGAQEVEVLGALIPSPEEAAAAEVVMREEAPRQLVQAVLVASRGLRGRRRRTFPTTVVPQAVLAPVATHHF